MDEYILTLVMLHLIAESPVFMRYCMLELWSTHVKDDSDRVVTVISREGKIPERLD